MSCYCYTIPLRLPKGTISLWQVILEIKWAGSLEQLAEPARDVKNLPDLVVREPARDYNSNAEPARDYNSNAKPARD